MIVITEPNPTIKKYRLQYYDNGIWHTILTGDDDKRIKIHRFDPVKGSRVKILIDHPTTPPSIAEFGVYREER